MTIDGMMTEDVERIFGKRTHKTLQEINFDVGNKVIDIWVESGIKQAKRDIVLPYHLPEYLDLYIKKRYENYNKEEHT